MGSDLNAVKSANYEITLDNSAGLIILFDKKKASSFETHDAIVTIYRDENKNILGVQIEYLDDDEDTNED